MPDARKMTDGVLKWLADRFEESRARMRAVAYRILGSLAEADDAVQEAWLRLSGAETNQVENLNAWLTTIVARVSLNMVRSRQARPEVLVGPYVPDPIIDSADTTDPEHEAVLADAVGLALQVVVVLVKSAHLENEPPSTPLLNFLAIALIENRRSFRCPLA
jgi:RNA polymerase sigma-70 factor (ECF subfamily)